MADDSDSAGPPVSLIGAECDELVPLATIHGVLDADVVPRESTVSGITDWSLVSQAIFDTALKQNGGISCFWANSDPAAFADTFRGVSIRILPNAAESWATAYPYMASRLDEISVTGGSIVPMGDASITDCGNEGYYGDCFYDVLVGDYWVQAEAKINNVDYDHLDDLGVIVRAAAEAVSALPAPGAGWAPPSGTPTTCDGVLPIADVRTQLGVPELVENFAFGDLFNLDWGVNESALAQAGGLHCRWVTPETVMSGSTFDLVVLPGGAWDWDGTAAPPLGAFDVPLAATPDLGDAAWGGCLPDYLRCTLHVLDDGSWYVLSAGGSTSTLPALVTLAHAVLT